MIMLLRNGMFIKGFSITASIKGELHSQNKLCLSKDSTFNRLFPKYLGPNRFIKGEIDCESSRFLQNPTPS